MKILIADDDRMSRRLLEGRLRAWGYDVIAVNNGGEAWKVLDAEQAPRLAVLDWMMPVLDGVEVCKRLRQQSRDGGRNRVASLVEVS